MVHRLKLNQGYFSRQYGVFLPSAAELRQQLQSEWDACLRVRQSVLLQVFRTIRKIVMVTTIFVFQWPHLMRADDERSKPVLQVKKDLYIYVCLYFFASGEMLMFFFSGQVPPRQHRCGVSITPQVSENIDSREDFHHNFYQPQECRGVEDTMGSWVAARIIGARCLVHL